MTKLHWLMLLALFLAVAPKLAAVVVKRNGEVAELKLALQNCQTGLSYCIEGEEICLDSLNVLMWKEQQRKLRRRHK